MNFFKKQFLFLCFIIFFFPFVVQAQEALPPIQQDEFYRAVVVSEPEEHPEMQYGQFSVVQNVTVRLTNGPEKGKELQMTFDIPDGGPGSMRLEKSDKVIVGKSLTGGVETYYISDIYRLDALWIALGIFFVFVILLVRTAGLRAILGLVMSFGIIVWFIVPRIIDGQNALLIGFLGTLGIATTSLYIAHGFRARTSIAFVSTLVTILFSLFSAFFFTSMTHLFGLGSEEAFYLQATPEKAFNLRGILIAGIIIGVLGVLDDITTAQAAVVEELHEANKSLGIRELFRRGFSVGREHIVSLVNTLVLAYTGASLPLLLLFNLYDRPTWLVLNSEIIMEELVRMLIGSIALLLAVPITTALAAWYFGRRVRT